VLHDPRGIRRDRRKAREIPTLPASLAPPRAVGIERVSSGRVTHRTRDDPSDIRVVGKHCRRLQWRQTVNHKDRNLRNTNQKWRNALSPSNRLRTKCGLVD
jgi:hypothetical protein